MELSTRITHLKVGVNETISMDDRAISMSRVLLRTSPSFNYTPWIPQATAREPGLTLKPEGLAAWYVRPLNLRPQNYKARVESELPTLTRARVCPFRRYSPANRPSYQVILGL